MTSKSSAISKTVIGALENYDSLQSLQRSPLKSLTAIQMLLPREQGLLEPHAVGVAIRRLLMQALERLRQRQPEAATLLEVNYIQNMPNKEAARHLGLGDSTFYDHRRKALEALEAIIAEMEADAVEGQREVLRQRMARLPAPTYQRLIGVEPFLEQIQLALQAGLTQRGSPLVILGLGGIGKTSLALETILRWLTQESPPVEQVLFVRVDSSSFLGDSSPYLLDQILFTLGEQLDLPLAALPNPEQRLRVLSERLAKESCLLFLDNVETPHDVQVVEGLMTRLAPLAQVLITSRREVAYPTVKPLHLGELAEAHALALLEAETQRLGVDPLDESSQRKIFAAVGGHPLALKLVVGQVSKLPLDNVLAALHRSSHVADPLYTRIYETTWAMLSEVSRTLLLGLILLPPAGATWDGLRHAVEGSGLDADDAALESAVQELSAFNLLQISPTRPPIYSLHRLTYRFLEWKSGLLQGEEEV